MTAGPIAWRVTWLSRSAPSGRPSTREFTDQVDAEAFLNLVKRVFPPDDLALARLEPRPERSLK